MGNQHKVEEEEKLRRKKIFNQYLEYKKVFVETRKQSETITTVKLTENKLIQV